MRVDLVVPAFPPAHWNFAFAMDVEGSRYSHLPLGVATLAAYTPPGVEVRIFDENVAPLDIDSLAPVVGLSAMYIQRARTFELARRLRASGRKVLLGGGLVMGLPTQSRAVADVLFHGEAELTWPQALADLDAGREQDAYTAPSRFDLTRSRLPRYDLLDLRAYSTGSIQTSRGCPYACDYCDVPLIDGATPRTKTVDMVMAEVDHLQRAGHRSTFFVDDHFFGNRKYALTLLAEIARWIKNVNPRPLFYCQATLNLAKDEVALEALREANFRRVFMGIESDSADELRAASKPQNAVMPLVEAVKKIQSHNITVWAALLAGFDGDGPETFDRYRAFAREASIGMIIPGLLQAVPGTVFHERVEREGRLLPLPNGYVAGQAGSLDSLLVTNVRPKRLTLKELVGGYRRFVRDLYEYDAYAERVIGFLDQGQMPEAHAANLGDVWAARGILARMFRWYVIDGDADRRRFFLRFVRYLLAARGRRLDEAVFHLVIYKHLREFYFTTADARVPIAEDLRTAEA